MDFGNIIDLIGNKLEAWGRLLVKMLPNLVLAMLIIAIALRLSIYVGRAVAGVFHRLTQNTAVADLMAGLARFGAIAIGIFYALGILDLDKTVTSLLAGAGIIGIALGFAFQDIASNFMSGTFIAFLKPFRVGDIVSTGEYEGKIRHIDLRTTVITTYDGLDVIVPNKDMFTSPIVNYTATPERRVDVSLGVSYGEDLNRVEDITRRALEQLDERIQDRPVEFFYKAFGASSIDFDLRVWIDQRKQSYLKARHEIIKLIKQAYDTEDIVIPFPIQTLDFGIKGGVPLQAQLPPGYERAELKG